MSDFKSKLPDLKELASISSKLYTDIKKSVGEIVQSYKNNRAQQAAQNEQNKPQDTQEKQQANEATKAENKSAPKETPTPEEPTAESPTTDESKK